MSSMVPLCNVMDRECVRAEHEAPFAIFFRYASGCIESGLCTKKRSQLLGTRYRSFLACLLGLFVRWT